MKNEEQELIAATTAAAAALNAVNKKEQMDEAKASKGDGMDIDEWDLDSKKQDDARANHNAAKEALKKFRVANAAILATIKMRPKNAGQEGDGQDI